MKLLLLIAAAMFMHGQPAAAESVTWRSKLMYLPREEMHCT